MAECDLPTPVAEERERWTEHAYYCLWPESECLGAPCEEVRRG